MGIVCKIHDFICKIRRKIWIKKLRFCLKNRDFSIISNNCCAGIIYSDLGLKFLSPTINLYFSPEDYLLFCKHLEAYIKGKMTDASDPNVVSFPIGCLHPSDACLPNIRIYFMHYQNYEDASAIWYKRCSRIKYENLFFLWEYNKSNTKLKTIQEFDGLPVKKMILTYDDLPEVVNYYKFKFSDHFNPGEILKVLPNGKRNLDEFNYVDFLNS